MSQQLYIPPHRRRAENGVPPTTTATVAAVATANSSNDGNSYNNNNSSAGERNAENTFPLQPKSLRWLREDSGPEWGNRQDRRALELASDGVYGAPGDVKVDGRWVSRKEQREVPINSSGSTEWQPEEMQQSNGEETKQSEEETTPDRTP
ncbi:hypothetical protein GGR58DRAFT_527440 [Xylaria digitata]|nr:hypothetical protein GGR58DRAFT_527440 [Xylaria digitata]